MTSSLPAARGFKRILTKPAQHALLADCSLSLERWQMRKKGSNLQNHPSQQVVQHTDRMLSLVVGRDGNVQVRQWAVRVAESDRGNIDIARLLHNQNESICIAAREVDQTRMHAST
jgi:hypothetical protein